MTQEDVGKIVGVSQVMISLWELGRRRIPARRKDEFALVLEVPAAILFPEGDGRG